jgi:hypothetical protein
LNLAIPSIYPVYLNPSSPLYLKAILSTLGDPACLRARLNSNRQTQPSRYRPAVLPNCFGVGTGKRLTVATNLLTKCVSTLLPSIIAWQKIDFALHANSIADVK